MIYFSVPLFHVMEIMDKPAAHLLFISYYSEEKQPQLVLDGAGGVSSHRVRNLAIHLTRPGISKGSWGCHRNFQVLAEKYFIRGAERGMVSVQDFCRVFL